MRAPSFSFLIIFRRVPLPFGKEILRLNGLCLLSGGCNGFFCLLKPVGSRVSEFWPLREFCGGFGNVCSSIVYNICTDPKCAVFALISRVLK